jgi:hypothetical protein
MKIERRWQYHFQITAMLEQFRFWEKIVCPGAPRRNFIVFKLYEVKDCNP